MIALLPQTPRHSFGFVVCKLVKTVVIIYRTTAWFSVVSLSSLSVYTATWRYKVNLNKCYSYCTTTGLPKLDARCGEIYFICCWFFHWPSSTGPSLCVLLCFMLSCKTCETEQHYYNLL